MSQKSATLKGLQPLSAEKTDEKLDPILAQIPDFAKRFPQVMRLRASLHDQWQQAHDRGDIEERERIRELSLELDNLKSVYDDFLRKGLAWKVWALGGKPCPN